MMDKTKWIGMGIGCLILLAVVVFNLSYDKSIQEECSIVEDKSYKMHCRTFCEGKNMSYNSAYAFNDPIISCFCLTIEDCVDNICTGNLEHFDLVEVREDYR